jgi:SAM-dependent methyltransferase
MNESLTRHLDLGCGDNPRNPYRRDELHGVDFAESANLPAGVKMRLANLSVDLLPYSDSYFDSVSAYDFLEHIPRIMTTSAGLNTRFPFIELMNEIWRVLTPGGLLYAQTPAYPHPAAFQDPTHVNILTRETHNYFTRPMLTGRMYGFKGDFEARRTLMTVPRHEYEPTESGLMDRLRAIARKRRGADSHLIWEFKAIK